MAETIIWTIVFVGGDFLVLVGLLSFAIVKDKQKLAGDESRPST